MTMPEESQADDTLESAPPSVSSVGALTEDLALASLKERDLTPDAVEQIGQNAAVMKSRKVRLAVAAHPRAPRHIALRVIRELYTFELMRFALLPTAVADLKRVADGLLLSRLPSVTLGERISLARRSSSLVAGALLLDKETRVWQTALENPRLSESAIVRALQRASVTPAFVEAVCHHLKWSPRPEIRAAILCNAHTPLAKAIEFARRLPPAQLRDILHTSRLPEKTKQYLRRDLESRGKSGKASL
jgi:hypothetical protein